MASDPPAKFFVNQGLVTSRTDVQHLLRPILKQTVSYRFLPGRETWSRTGSGWVERIVADEPEISTYFTPISITINVDSFEHLEFETRPDQLLVYTLVQGDERVVIEFVPAAADDETRPSTPRQLEFDIERVRPDGAPRPGGDRGVGERRAGGYRPRSPRTYGIAERRRRPDPLAHRRCATRARARRSTSAYGSISRKNVFGVVLEERVGQAEDRGRQLHRERELDHHPEQVGAGRGPERRPLGEDHEPDRDPAPAVHRQRPEPARLDRERDRRARRGPPASRR